MRTEAATNWVVQEQIVALGEDGKYLRRWLMYRPKAVALHAVFERDDDPTRPVTPE